MAQKLDRWDYQHQFVGDRCHVCHPRSSGNDESDLYVGAVFNLFSCVEGLVVCYSGQFKMRISYSAYFCDCSNSLFLSVGFFFVHAKAYTEKRTRKSGQACMIKGILLRPTQP